MIVICWSVNLIIPGKQHNCHSKTLSFPLPIVQSPLSCKQPLHGHPLVMVILKEDLSSGESFLSAFGMPGIVRKDASGGRPEWDPQNVGPSSRALIT